jgi:hypothetical protein
MVSPSYPLPILEYNSAMTAFKKSISKNCTPIQNKNKNQIFMSNWALISVFF